MSEALNLKPNAQILEEASAWFVEFNEGEVSPEARNAFSAWLKASPEHVRAYLAVSATFEEVSRLGGHRTQDAQALIARALADGNIVSLPGPGAHVSPNAGEALQAVTQPLQEKNKKLFWRARDDASPATNVSSRWRASRGLLAASAAAFAIGLTALTLWANWQKGLYTTGIGEQRIVNLSDGSTLELNAESRVRVHLNDAERIVDLLRGQALFQVAKDPQRPFIVRSDGTRVRAVGTQFDVNRQATHTVVTVLEGRVAVARAVERNAGAPNDEVPLYVSAGEQVILTAQAASKPAHPDVAAATAWRERKLVFASSPLLEVVGEYNRYHEKRLVIADTTLSDFRISGVFSAADATSLIAFLKAQSNIDVDERGNEIVLRAK